ncbi:MAG: sugar kinase [Arenicella sp.]|nr:sugar kinase [Arenicella sp.]
MPELKNLKPLNIGFFGEAMIEISGEPLSKNFSGDVLNTAIYLKRLSRKSKQDQRNINCKFITALGKDSISDEMMAVWEQQGLDLELVVRLRDKKPGLYLVENFADGERVFHYWRDSSAAKYYFQSEQSKLADVLNSNQLDYFYLSGISLAILSPDDRRNLLGLLGAFRDRGGKIIFDNNYRPALWEAGAVEDIYLSILGLSYIALLTDVDELLVFGSDDSDEIIQRCRSLGVTEIVIKYGADPCVIYAENRKIAVPSCDVDRVVSTSAAGDSFAAAYLYCRLLGGPIDEAARQGHDLAAKVIQYSGAIIPEAAH